jgi:hypothetical protein
MLSMRPSLKSLGIDKSAVPLLKDFLQGRREFEKIRSVRVNSEESTGQPEKQFMAPILGFTGTNVPKPRVKAKAKTRISPSEQYRLVRRTLDEKAFYPKHEKRRASAEYRNVHQTLIRAHGCLICGVTYETLNRSKTDLKLNPYGAKQLETHHHIIEWALANAIDPDKFNALLFPNLKARHPDRYTQPLNEKEIKDWVDHSPDNLWVLCDVHHRAKWFGIHEITQPIWGPQDIFDDQYLAAVRALIKKDRSPRSKRKKKAKKGR